MNKEVQYSAPSGATYGLGFIGSAICFISTAGSIWVDVMGFLKAVT